jgi:predicted amidohydrolase YtcJ
VARAERGDPLRDARQRAEAPAEYQYNSTRHFMRELNRLGVTSVCDAGGGFQNYRRITRSSRTSTGRRDDLRIAYNLFTQKPGGELEIRSLVEGREAGDGRRHAPVQRRGRDAGFSAADFEDFLEPRPDLPDRLEADLERVVRSWRETGGRSGSTRPTTSRSRGSRTF